jgi:hypothetical protein
LRRGSSLPAVNRRREPNYWTVIVAGLLQSLAALVAVRLTRDHGRPIALPRPWAAASRAAPQAGKRPRTSGRRPARAASPEHLPGAAPQPADVTRTSSSAPGTTCSRRGPRKFGSSCLCAGRSRPPLRAHPGLPLVGPTVRAAIERSRGDDGGEPLDRPGECPAGGFSRAKAVCQELAGKPSGRVPHLVAAGGPRLDRIACRRLLVSASFQARSYELCSGGERHLRRCGGEPLPPAWRSILDDGLDPTNRRMRHSRAAETKSKAWVGEDGQIAPRTTVR